MEMSFINGFFCLFDENFSISYDNEAIIGIKIILCRNFMKKFSDQTIEKRIIEMINTRNMKDVPHLG